MFIINNNAYSITNVTLLLALISLATSFSIGLIFYINLPVKSARPFYITMLVMYLLSLSILTTLPVGKMVSNVAVISKDNLAFNFNFDLTKVATSLEFRRDFLINLIMLFPLGFLIEILLKVKFSFVISFVICVLISVIIECVQLGIVSRVSDINDVVVNVIGAILGVFSAGIVKLAGKTTDKS